MQGLGYVDIIIVAFLVIYVLLHMRHGFFTLTRQLVAFIGSIIFSFLLYHHLSTLISKYISLQSGLLDATSFAVLFIFFQIVINQILKAVFRLVPIEVEDSWPMKFLAVIPAFIDGVIIVSLILLILVVAPVLPQVKGPIEDSRIGGVLVDKIGGIETYVDSVFGQAAQESLGFLTVEPDDGQSIKLPYKPKTLTVDEKAEAQMLILVNQERAKVGAKPLKLDTTLVSVARAHSTDMWQRQYFAHTDPDGKSPFDRMTAAGVIFTTAGENLALAQTVERAHEGLMNSPGHRRNILDPAFGRIGIGVIDGGVYGKMFTQDFAN